MVLISTRLFLIALIFMLSFEITWAREAGIDYRLGVGGRTTPLGGAGFGEVGYGLPVWGEWTEPDSILYGFIRPALGMASTLTYNSFDLRADFHPISFIRFAAGRTHVFRPDSKAQYTVDCRRYECGGELIGEYVEVDLILAHGPWFLGALARVQDVQAKRDLRVFYEDAETVLGDPGGDRFRRLSLQLGRSIDSLEFGPFRTGIVVRHSIAEKSGDYGTHSNLFLNHDAQGLNWTYAIGVYESGRSPAEFQLAVALSWIPKPGLLLK